jgi:hypothetical protein
MIRFLLITVLSFVLIQHGHAQFIKKDSLVLASISDQKLMKVVAKNDKKNLISVGWYTQTDTTHNLFVQNFTYEGRAISAATQIVSAKISKSYYAREFNFDLDTDTLGNTLIAWSEYDSNSYSSYKIKYSGIDPYGRIVHAPKIIGTSAKIFVKASINIHGEFLISWFAGGGIAYGNAKINIQLFDKSYDANGPIISTYYNEYIDENTFPVTLTDSTQVVVASFLRINILNSKGIKIHDGDGNITSCCFNALDMDYLDEKIVQSFSRSKSPTFASSGTFISILSRYNSNQYNNLIEIDPAESTVSKISQNKSGSTFVTWKNTLNEIKALFQYNSGQPISNPIKLWKDSQSIRATSFDVILRNSQDALIVYGLDGTTKGNIVLQRIQFLPIEETKEIIASQRLRQDKSINRSLSSNHTNVVVWMTSELKEGNYKSAIFAQIFDRKLNKIGDTINITGFKDHEFTYYEPYFDFECAIDTAGNFMVVWQEYSDPVNRINVNANIYAKKYNALGSIERDVFQVNQAPLQYDVSNIRPKVASTSNGNFLVIWQLYNWRLNDSSLKARFIKEGNEGIEKIIREYFGAPSIKHELVLNDDGNFAVGYRSGYYSFVFLIFDQNMKLISDFSDREIADTKTNFDLALTNQNKIILLFTNSSLQEKILLKTYNLSGESLSELLLDKNTTTLRKPDLSINQKGDYCALYEKNGSILVQKFKNDNQKDGPIFRINSFLNYGSRISYNYDNEIFGSWSSSANSDYRNDILVKGVYNKLSGSIGKDYGDNFILPKTPSKPKSLITKGDYLSRQLSWTPNTEPYIAGYSIYRSMANDTLTASKIDNSTSAIFTDSKKISSTGTLYYWVKAYNNLNQTSFFSNVSELGVTVPVPPSKPKSLIVKGDYDTRTLSWLPNTELDLSGYSIYRSSVNDTLTSSKIGNSSSANFIDTTNRQPNEVLYYWVRAYNKTSQISQYSDVGYILVSEIQNQSIGLSIFPNPTDDRLYIDPELIQNIIQIDIIDMLGNRYPQKYNKAEPFISIGSMASGLYYLVVTTDKIQISSKIIKR